MPWWAYIVIVTAALVAAVVVATIAITATTKQMERENALMELLERPQPPDP